MNPRKNRRTLLAALLVGFMSLPLSGCASSLENSKNLGGQSVRKKMKMRAGGFHRSYRVHIPKGYDPQKAYPLVVVLHGAFSTGKQMEAHTGFSEIADREGFIVLYPNGITLFGLFQHWNAGHCCAKAADDDLDDVGYLKAAIGEVSEKLNVDDARIYMTGFSNGGMMTNRFGAEETETVAAIAPMAGSIGGRKNPEAPFWQIPSPNTTLPVLIMHGKQDKQVPYEGGGEKGGEKGRQYVSAQESAEFWARANGCQAVPRETNLHGGSVTLQTWVGCRDGSEVRLYTWVHWGHSWPGPPFTDTLEPDDPFRQFNAAEVVWEFFKSHERN